jgi:hypothetical protein
MVGIPKKKMDFLHSFELRKIYMNFTLSPVIKLNLLGQVDPEIGRLQLPLLN